MSYKNEWGYAGLDENDLNVRYVTEASSSSLLNPLERNESSFIIKFQLGNGAGHLQSLGSTQNASSSYTVDGDYEDISSIIVSFSTYYVMYERGISILTIADYDYFRLRSADISEDAGKTILHIPAIKAPSSR